MVKIQLMNANKPTPPDGYEVMLGKDVPSPVPAGTQVWGEGRWRPTAHGGSGKKTHPSKYPTDTGLWYAVPIQQPSAPEGYALARQEGLPKTIPDKTLFWDRAAKKWQSSIWDCNNSDGRCEEPEWYAVPVEEDTVRTLCPTCHKPECKCWDTTAATALDTQVGGSHYKEFAIQPAEFIIKNNLGFAEGAVIKYVCRHGQKNGAEDLDKAIHYLQILKEMKYGKTS